MNVLLALFYKRYTRDLSSYLSKCNFCYLFVIHRIQILCSISITIETYNVYYTYLYHFPYFIKLNISFLIILTIFLNSPIIANQIYLLLNFFYFIFCVFWFFFFHLGVSDRYRKFFSWRILIMRTYHLIVVFILFFILVKFTEHGLLQIWYYFNFFY